MFNKSNMFLPTVLTAAVLLLIVGCGDDDNPVSPVKATVTDIDGNVYSVVRIGDQKWMAENLKVTHYRNGDAITKVTDGGQWIYTYSGAYCEYDNDSANVEIYGRMYNWYAINDSRNIAPEGWHVPTDCEWKQLEIYLGMNQIAADSTDYRGTDEGGKLKGSDTIYWRNPNTGATDESGFSALPGGYRMYNPIGYPPEYFDGQKFSAYFWSATENSSDFAIARNLYYYDSRVCRISNIGKISGLSIRCVKD